MDISNFFWDFIDYELNLKKTVSVLEQKVFHMIRKGDLIMNSHHLDETEPNEYLYYDSLYELISMAARVCTGEKLNKIEKYVDLYFEDQELAAMFDMEMDG
jgi:hypothetical protein